MDIFLLAILILVGFIILAVIINRKLSNIQKLDPTLLEWIKSTQANMQTNSMTITRVLQEHSKQLNERLDRASQTMQEVNREVGKMSEIGRSMEELQQFLKNPKVRGNLGEQVLKDLISQIFPKNSFHLQYAFKSGEKVDAAIKTDAGILCIDAKFPMENFQRLVKAKTDEEKTLYTREFSKDVKRHIDAISKKYIMPDEGTMDFALMYVPSESVFYEIVNTDDIVEYAKQNRIYIVSPSTLYAHLQTILLSFEGKKIESRSKEVFQLLRGLQTDYVKVTESLDTLGKHITNASNQFSNVNRGFMQIGQKLSSTKQIEEKIADQ